MKHKWRFSLHAHIFLSLAISLYFWGGEVGFSLPFFASTFFPPELRAKCFRFRNNSMPNANNIHTYMYSYTNKKNANQRQDANKSEHLFYQDNYNTQHQYLHDLHLKITNSASISIQMPIQRHWPRFARSMSEVASARARAHHTKCHCLFYGNVCCWYVLFCISKMI